MRNEEGRNPGILEGARIRARKMILKDNYYAFYSYVILGMEKVHGKGKVFDMLKI